MTNTEYLAAMAQANDRIYIDTASIMNAEWFRQFAENATPIFQAAHKRITIATAVRSELCRHMESADSRKQEDALAAMNVISQHKELFNTAGGELDDEEIARAFADAELLAELMIFKKEGNQLLITNDRKLSSDAFELNQQQSNHGYRINVCHINRFGFLQMCDCVKAFLRPEASEGNVPEVKANSLMKEEISIDAESVEVSAEQTCSLEQSEGNQSTVKQILIFVGGLTSGILLGKYGGQIITEAVSLASKAL